MRMLVCRVVLGLATTFTACVAPDGAESPDEASQADDITVRPATTFTLTASSIEGGVNFLNPDGTTTLCDEGCTRTYAAGSVVRLQPAMPTNTVDCLQFNHWNGACAGQGVTCTLTVNSNLSASVAYARITRCIPK